MDDPVVPYTPRSGSTSPAMSLTSSQSAYSLTNGRLAIEINCLPCSDYHCDIFCSTGPSPTPSLPQKPAPVTYRVNRTGSFQQKDKWQKWNMPQIRRTVTAPEASTTGSSQLSPDNAPSISIGTFDMDVDGYFKRSSNISNDTLSVTTTDTQDSVPGRSVGDSMDFVPPAIVEQGCSTDNGADVASQSSEHPKR